jgi:hypothetical protein
MRRALDLVLTQEIEAPTSVTGHARKLASLATRCRRCSGPLPFGSTVRRRYCSDVCRVTAWRERERASDPRSSES